MVLVVIGTIIALAWMCYRASSLLKIPIPTLVKLLGLDLPAPPRVSLHGIAADTITLHWSLPEKAGSVAKHIIQINGINVGESEKRGETSVTVTGLNPDHLYNVRVIAANSHNFQAPGQLIRLRTRRKSASLADGSSRDAAGKSDSAEEVAVVQPALETQQGAHHHHHSNSGHHSRRAVRERRSSPAAVETQSVQSGAQGAEEQHSVESLTATLEVVRREIDETEAQLAHTEEEFKAAEQVLRAELDLLKEKKNEEDTSRAKLRSETRALEEAKRAAEALRTKTDRSLRSKEDEIKKMRDDSARWDEERLAALGKVEELGRMARERREHARSTERELSEEMRETQKSIVEMEEEIRALVGAIKALETQREQWKTEEEAESVRIAEDERDEREWRARQRKLETRYVNVYNSFQTAEIDYLRSKALLAAAHSHGDAAAPPKKAKQRRHRNRKSRTHTGSSGPHAFAPPDPGFPAAAGHSHMHLPRQLASAFSGSPFFNIANGAAPPDAADAADPLSASMELERLSGGGPMSPTANALLPSNLFAFEDSPPSPHAASPALADARGLGLIPQSPQSSNSASTHLSSPGSSFHHIPLFPHHADADAAPATQPDDAPSGGRRFVKLFSNSFVRTRGKTVPLDAPLLGSLRPAETRSVPKSPDPGLDPIGTRRRSGSHGSWATDFLHASRFKRGGIGLERTASESSRRSAFNPFNASFDPIEPARLFESPVSPRPSSIASFDNALPIPSSDVGAAFGWPADDPGMSVPRNRVSLLGTSWSDFRVPAPSRPISPLHGNSSSVSLSLAPQQQQSAWFPPPPPQPLHPTTPRLNPAAPTFEARSTKDSLSINTDTSSMDTPSNSGLLSRFSALSRKGSTSKFNLPGWKKDGSGFFGRKPTAKEASSDVDEPEDLQGSSSTSFVAGGSPVVWKDKGGGFFGRGGEEEKEKGVGLFGTIGRRREEERGEGLQGIFGRKKRGGEEKVGESEGEGV